MEDLNRLSAEKVMGWEIGLRDLAKEDLGRGKQSYWRNDKEWVYPAEGWNRWNPLKDKNQCFEVVEKMPKFGHRIIIHQLTKSLDKDGKPTDRITYSVETIRVYDNTLVFASDGNTREELNEAILKAAIEAVENEKSDRPPDDEYVKGIERFKSGK
jgi:hypothetical protein